MSKLYEINKKVLSAVEQLWSKGVQNEASAMNVCVFVCVFSHV